MSLQTSSVILPKQRAFWHEELVVEPGAEIALNSGGFIPCTGIGTRPDLA